MFILVVVDYVCKWVEAVACKTKDQRVVAQFLKDKIFARFGTPRAIISDGGKHFYNRIFKQLMKKYFHHTQGCHSISPSDEWSSGDFEPRDQEDFGEDGEPVKKRLFFSFEQRIVGLPDSIQDTDWHVTLPSCVRQSMSSASGAGA
jgi:hypothetical protein